jgi:hypothetical protein
MKHGEKHFGLCRKHRKRVSIQHNGNATEEQCGNIFGHIVSYPCPGPYGDCPNPIINCVKAFMLFAQHDRSDLRGMLVQGVTASDDRYKASADCQCCLRRQPRRASAQYRAADHHRAATGIFVHATRRWMQMGAFDHAFS